MFDRALDALIVQLERAKLAAAARPRRQRRPTTSRRHIPAHVKRIVWARDGGQCTFVSMAGRRCSARTRLEFDHVQEVARGGEATVANVCLRCRVHNQLAAESTFGAAFMNHKVEQARHAAAARAGAGDTRAGAATPEASQAHGCRAGSARPEP